MHVDIAIICATNKNLKEMIANGSFREDLYYRLNGLVVRLPALRERKDLEVVAQKILASVCPAGKHIGISQEVIDLFRRHAWPGNFRQMFNLLRTAVIMADGSTDIELFHLSDDFLSEAQQQPEATKFQQPTTTTANTVTKVPSFDTSTTEALSLENVAIDAIAQALRTSNGNVSAAAKLLGVSRNTIYRKKHLLPNEFWN